MKSLKFRLVLLIIVFAIDLGLVFVDDGNKLVSVEHNAEVVSCEVSNNTGLDTYYTVTYTYKDGDSTIKGRDNYYLKEVSEGDTITISTREQVQGKYATILYYASIVCNCLVGVLAFSFLYSFFKRHKFAVKDVEPVSEPDKDDYEY